MECRVVVVVVKTATKASCFDHFLRDAESLALYIFTWNCASRHDDVHFDNISTSKSGPNMVCFENFGLETCFPPQQRALF